MINENYPSRIKSVVCFTSHHITIIVCAAAPWRSSKSSISDAVLVKYCKCVIEPNVLFSHTVNKCGIPEVVAYFTYENWMNCCNCQYVALP